MPMTQPAVVAAARNRAAILEELRRLLPGMTDIHKTFAFGLPALDSCLPDGGLACGALHEIVAEPHATPAALGFIAALLAHLYSPPPCGEGLGVGVGRFSKNDKTLTKSGNALTPPHDPPPYPPPQGKMEKFVFVLPAYGLRDHGRLYGHGLSALGLDPERLILVETARRNDTLWAIEEALRSGAPAAVAGIVDQLDLKLSQRLHLAAVDCGLPLFLLRPAHNLESSAAATRWRVGTAEALRDRFGLLVRPRWHLSLERCRNGRPGEWSVEYDHVAHRFSLAAALADSARARRAGKANKASETTDREAYCA
jgi:protein ImuA